MDRIVYVNGDYCPEEDAKVSVFDRAFLFADAVYEATSVVHGKLIDFHAHMGRLQRSLYELELNSPASPEELLAIHRELIARNELEEGIVYLQVSRGVADRDFKFPITEPTLIMFTQSRRLLDNPVANTGIKVIAVEDLRWGRRDIKTVQLLYSSMSKMAADKAGADDAWLVKDGYVTEGTSNNAFIVTANGEIVTRELSNDILHGITRRAVLKLAREAQMKIVERPFTIKEAQAASEAFITSAGTFVHPVIAIDGEAVGSGVPGQTTVRLREIYISEMVKNGI